MRVLIVEDEMLIALLLEDMLSDLGHEVVATAMRLSQAVELAGSVELDLAILDVNLDGLKSFPVADVLSARGVPFVFATGYGVAGLEPPYEARTVIKKPFSSATLQTAIRDLAAAQC